MSKTRQITDDLKLLLTPSWASGFISAVCALAVTVGSMVISGFQSSTLHQQLFSYQVGQTSTDLSSNYGSVSNSFLSSNLVGSLVVLIIWGLVGVAAYMFIDSIWRMSRNVAEIKRELDYVHADRQQLLETAFLHLAIRITVILIWTPFIVISFRMLLPYSITAAHIAQVYLISLNSLTYALLSLLIIILCLHINTILLRLLFLRTRVFSNN